MVQRGAGIFFDGRVSARRSVEVELYADMLCVRDGDGTVLAEWPFAAVEQAAGPKDVLRLAARGSPVPARLELRDPSLSAVIRARCGALSGDTDPRARRRAAFWGIAAATAAIAGAVALLPVAAARLTPLVPLGVERSLGTALDAQVRSLLDADGLGARFDCAEPQARAVLETLVARLAAAAPLPFPPQVVVIRRPEANAIALPGGRIYLFRGLLERAESGDQVAAAIAHELAHVANRDGIRTVLHGAGLTFLFGLVLGDFGGGAALVAARTLVEAAHSRDAEMQADAFAVDLLARIGSDGRALAALLSRLDAESGAGRSLWLHHPETAARLQAIAERARPGAGHMLLTADQWAVLRRICDS